MNNIVFGRYVNANTFVHKLDPRTKIFLLILFSVGIFLQFTNNITNLLMSCCYLGAVFILMFITRINVLNIFKSLSMMWFMLLFLFIVYVLTPIKDPTLGVAFNLFGKDVYWDTFVNMGYIVLRLMILISLAMVLTSSTRPMDMTYAFEWYMYPLKVIRFPVHEIATCGERPACRENRGGAAEFRCSSRRVAEKQRKQFLNNLRVSASLR